MSTTHRNGAHHVRDWRSLLRPLALFAALPMLLTACVTYEVPDVAYQPFNRQAHRGIKTIGILLPATRDELKVRIVNPAENNFPLLGPLIAEGVMKSKSDEFDKLASEAGFEISKELGRALGRGVREAGFEIKGVTVDRKPGRFLKRYPIDSEVDAWLDSYSTHGGYFAAGTGTPYRATALVGVRLVSASDRRHVLFSDSFVYNAIGDTGDAITILAGDEASFRNYEALIADMDAALDGLRAAYTAIGDQLGRLLK